MGAFVTYTLGVTLVFLAHQVLRLMHPTAAPSFPKDTCRPSANARWLRGRRHRKGVILVLFALMLIVLMAILAFAIDIGVTVHHRAAAQNAVDAAALAGAAVLERGHAAVNGNAVRKATRQYFQLNQPGVNPQVLLGRWDPVHRLFDPGVGSQLEVNAVRVSAHWQFNSFFGRVLGHAKYAAGAEAIATGGRDVTGPRDIVLMIDQTSALLKPNPDEYAPSEGPPASYPLNAKRALKEAAERFIDYVLADYPDDLIGMSGFAADTALESGLTKNATALKNLLDINRPGAFLYSYQSYVDQSGGRYPGEPPRIELALDGSSQGQAGGYQIATGPASRSNAKKVLILISDGTTASDADSQAAAAQLAADGVHIHTIAVGASSLLMRRLVSGDGRSYLVPTPAESPAVTYGDMVQAFNTAFDKISGKEATEPKLVK
jgi:hypothetical protein